MGKPAARIGDMHVCPMVTGLVPHVGGPVSGPGIPTVLVGGIPAAVSGDMCACSGPPDTIVLGSTGVFIGGKRAARMGDQCAHGGKIVMGCTTVMIGETYVGSSLMKAPRAALDAVIRNMPQGISKVVVQEITLKKAAEKGAFWCEICQK